MQVYTNRLTYFNQMNLDKLQKAVKQSPMTKKEVARKSGISQQALSAIVNGGGDPRVSTLEAIVRVLGLKMSFLFDENNVEIKNVERCFNANADEIIIELTSIIKTQEDRIRQLTDKLLGL